MKLETKGSTIHPTVLANCHEQTAETELLSLHYFSLALVFPRVHVGRGLVYHSGNVPLEFSPRKAALPEAAPLFGVDFTRLRDPKGASYSVGGKHDAGARIGVRELEVTADFSFKSSPDVLASKLGSNPRLEMLIRGGRQRPLKIYLESFQKLKAYSIAFCDLINYFNIFVLHFF